jgi:hypothetical protein
MHHPETVVARLVFVRERFPGGVGIAKAGIAAPRREHPAGEQRGEDRHVVHRAVDMPVERALEVFGAGGVFFHIERDLGDTLVTFTLGRECAKRLGKRNLFVFVEIDFWEHQYAALLQQFADLGAEFTAQQFLLVVEDTAADFRLDIFSFETDLRGN